jgi:N-acetylneuraminate synthase
MIGVDHPPFIIAEMSGNHNQSLDRALQIVTAAARAGAHAIKLQTYTADTITLDVAAAAFVVADQDSLWYGRRLHELYREAHTPWEWHAPIMERAKTLGILCFSSPFDDSAVDFLQTLNVPAYKIASFENNHLPLIRKVAATGKPIIMSTGLATAGELAEAVQTARMAGCGDLMLLKCTSTYPASPRDTNILTIPDMRARFNCEVGLSDHTMGIGTAVAAVAHGACMIEKHFTLRRADGGVDSAFSLEPAELALLVEETERAWQSLGAVSYGPTAAEQKSLAFRRSLYVAEDMAAGDELTPRNLRIVRPAGGLHPRFYEQVLGRRVARAVPKGTAVDWSLLQ